MSRPTTMAAMWMMKSRQLLAAWCGGWTSSMEDPLSWYDERVHLFAGNSRFFQRSKFLSLPVSIRSCLSSYTPFRITQHMPSKIAPLVKSIIGGDYCPHVLHSRHFLCSGLSWDAHRALPE